VKLPLGTFAAITGVAVALADVALAAPEDGAEPEAITATAGAAAVPLIVLDPGHGGSNTGARGAVDGLLEKQLTLALANQVAAELRSAGLSVELTRSGDQTLTLRQRAAFANQRHADLFVSVHLNASPTRAQRGFETYVLTPAGVDVVAPALRGDDLTPRPGVSAEVASVLDDVERGAVQWESADLAAAMQRALRQVRGGRYDRGVRQDAHHVLLGATMPSVLVEVGFIDHPIEGRELTEPATQAAIAKAIAAAVQAQARERH
jgi:N-acetylmuramoyl-L-alanine amidase